MSLRSTMVLVAVALCASACGEKAQTATPAKKADGKPWDLAQSNSLANGWKGGDQSAWEAQMRTRAQGQNEYVRIAGAPPTNAATAPAASMPAAAKAP